MFYYGWKNYTYSKSEYYTVLNHLFVNKCLFNKEEVMIGIYEDIFSDLNDIKIEYYSDEEQPLNFY